MRVQSLSGLCVLFVLLGIVAATTYRSPQLWPLPQSYSLSGSDKYYLSPSFQFQSPSSSELLEEAFTRYYSILFPSGPSQGPFSVCFNIYSNLFLF